MATDMINNQFSLSEKVRILTEMLMRAYSESIDNEGVLTFDDMTGLAGSVLAGNRHDSTWFSESYKRPTEADVSAAKQLISELGLSFDHSGLHSPWSDSLSPRIAHVLLDLPLVD